MYQHLFEQLSDQNTIITVNKRLSSFLYQKYVEFQSRRHKNVWSTPDILPLPAWTERTFYLQQTLTNTQTLTLLNLHQQAVIWQQIIKQNTLDQWLEAANYAALAQEAWTICQEWQIDYTKNSFERTEESRYWQKWAKLYSDYCSQHQLIDSSLLLSWVTHSLHDVQNLLPKKIFLVGFDDVSPQLNQLIIALKNIHIEIEIIQNSSTNSQCQVNSFANANEELLAMANWVKQEWQVNKNNSFACIVPNLNQIRSTIENLFIDIFAPEKKLPGFTEKALPFNISIGKTLDQYPLIYMALHLLNLSDTCDYESISYLLTSPFIRGYQEESSQRAQLDIFFRNQFRYEITLQEIILYAKKMGCHDLAQQLVNFTQYLFKNDNHKRINEWRDIFNQQLNAIGWSHQEDYTLVEHWEELLNNFSLLDLALPTLTKKEAYYYLYWLASRIIYQPKNINSSIQIIGILEASGMYFDKVWVLGLADNIWPPTPQNNPFIPHKIQLQYNLPHSSSERELKYATVVTDRLVKIAPQVIFSYPQQQDERLLRPSALIKNIPIATPAENHFISFNHIIYSARNLEAWEDTATLPITTQESIKGGANIIKQQAACPFRSFAQFRLLAENMVFPDIGLTPLERGSLLHLCLEYIWKQLENQNNLLKANEFELEKIIIASIEKSLRFFTQKNPLRFAEKLCALETKRLIQLIKQWLIFEKNRPYFSVVASEQKIEFSLSQTQFSLRIDRVDQLTDGSLAIIDYKTGKASINSWESERPDEPQLLMYCLSNPQHIEAILFAQVKANDLRFKGISADNKNIPGIESVEINSNEQNSWKKLLVNWQKNLTQLTKAFESGVSLVDPKYAQKTCETCHLQLFCRVSEARNSTE